MILTIRTLAKLLGPVVGTALTLAACSVVPAADSNDYDSPGDILLSTESYSLLKNANDNTILFYTNDPAKLAAHGSTFWIAGPPQSWGGQTGYSYGVTLTKFDGQARGGYGIVFAATDVKNFLCAFITMDGYIQIGKVVARAYFPLYGWAKNKALIAGYGQPNTITVTYTPVTNTKEVPFRVYVNDEKDPVFSFDEPDYYAGNRVGLLTVLTSSERFPSAPVHVTFTVRQPSNLVIVAP